MKCLSCGAQLTDSVYCPICGCDNSAQQQAVILSGLYYNQGLEKAQIRDLSGAIDQLKRSLKFNKLNIQARNLLGLVYFETGEVVAALSEWVISKNMQPEENLASLYIANLQKDAGRLDVINQTIKKFNIALKNCQDGNEDVAMIQLKKILAQNPKLIKGYHLLSVLYMRGGEFERARKLLRKALKIDRTNTTTLRYLMEIEAATGTPAEKEGKWALPLRKKNAGAAGEEETAKRTVSPVFRERPFSAGVLGAAAGFLIGILAAVILLMPAARRRINTEANEKITEYSAETAALQEEVSSLNGELESAKQTSEGAVARINEAVTLAASYEQLAAAQRAYQAEDYEKTAECLAALDPSLLSSDAQSSCSSMENAVQSLLFTKLKERGLTKIGNGDYQAAVLALTRAAEINGDDEDVAFALTDAKNRLAEQIAQNGGVQVIPPQEG